MILKECDLQKGQIVHIHTSYYPMGNLYKSLKKNHGTGFPLILFIFVCTPLVLVLNHGFVQTKMLRI